MDLIETTSTRTLFCLLIIFICFDLHAQHLGLLSPDAGGEYRQPPSDHMSEEQRQSIIQMLQNNVQRLQLQGMDLRPSTITQVAFQWPLRKAAGFNDSGYCAISNYVDHSPPGSIVDYNCGNRSYDGHKGTDIYLWPFAWHKMFTSAVEVIASAPGTIIGKTDNFSDLSCATCSNCNWNAVYVQHADGSVAWYGHLKTGSVTSKTVGQAVVTGEYLGVVGSSGNSTGPHLHFEIYNTNYADRIDPYAGDCNGYNISTWWASQEQYRVPTLNTVMTHSSMPTPYGCHTTEVMNLKTQFILGEEVYLGSYYRDQIFNIISDHKLVKPGGTIHETWTSNNGAAYSSSWWIYVRQLPNDPSAIGTWKYEVTYNGKTVTTNFTVLDFPTSLPRVEGLERFYIAPNPSKGQFLLHLQLGMQRQVSFKVYDVAGKEVIQTIPESMNGRNSRSINLSHVPPGVYILYVTVGSQRFSEKLVRY